MWVTPKTEMASRFLFFHSPSVSFTHFLNSSNAPTPSPAPLPTYLFGKDNSGLSMCTRMCCLTDCLHHILSFYSKNACQGLCWIWLRLSEKKKGREVVWLCIFQQFVFVWLLVCELIPVSRFVTFRGLVCACVHLCVCLCTREPLGYESQKCKRPKSSTSKQLVPVQIMTAFIFLSKPFKTGIRTREILLGLCLLWYGLGFFF